MRKLRAPGTRECVDYLVAEPSVRGGEDRGKFTDLRFQVTLGSQDFSTGVLQEHAIQDGMRSTVRSMLTPFSTSPQSASRSDTAGPPIYRRPAGRKESISLEHNLRTIVDISMNPGRGSSSEKTSNFCLGSRSPMSAAKALLRFGHARNG